MIIHLAPYTIFTDYKYKLKLMISKRSKYLSKLILIWIEQSIFFWQIFGNQDDL